MIIDNKIDNKKKSFNYKHPEMKIGEKFIGNYTYERYLEMKSDCNRIGKNSYDRVGKLLWNNDIYFPVFKNEKYKNFDKELKL